MIAVLLAGALAAATPSGALVESPAVGPSSNASPGVASPPGSGASEAFGLGTGRAHLALEPEQVRTPSAWAAFGLSAACEVPTLLFGPSCGHLYAGEETHFFFTGGLRVLDFLGLVLLEKWGPGVGPLYAVVEPHFSRSLAAYPFAYPLDLVLVALWWGTGLYDLIDTLFVGHRHAAVRPIVAMPGPLSRSESALPLLRF